MYPWESVTEGWVNIYHAPRKWAEVSRWVNKLQLSLTNILVLVFRLHASTAKTANRPSHSLSPFHFYLVHPSKTVTSLLPTGVRKYMTLERSWTIPVYSAIAPTQIYSGSELIFRSRSWKWRISDSNSESNGFPTINLSMVSSLSLCHIWW